MRRLLAALAFVAVPLAAASFAGALHPAADTLALGRPVLLVICLLGVIAARARWLRLLSGAAGLVLAVSMAVHLLPQAPGGDIRIYSKNMWFANREIAAVAEDIRAARVDVVMLQEVSDRNAAILTLLKPDFPYQAFCRFSNWSGIAIASRHPFVGQTRCTTGRAAAAAQVRLEGRRVWVVSVHIPWLWPYDSADNEQAAAELIARLDGPVVIAGDFNAFPWTHRLGRIARAGRARLAGPLRPTFWYRGVPLALDFALAPGGGSVQIRPRLGSDHGGVVADLSLTAP